MTALVTLSRTRRLIKFTEIYRIVSSKALDNGDPSQNPIGERKVLEISKSADADSKGGKCC